LGSPSAQLLAKEFHRAYNPVSFQKVLDILKGRSSTAGFWEKETMSKGIGL
jgi:hypothetical protein